MDSIRVFLENMFYGISPTPAVKRAKEELLAMMEDKYHELKAGGASENAAVGQVIAEFGNLVELADDLGIRTDMQERTPTADKPGLPILFLSEAQAMELLQNRANNARRIGLGVVLCILSPAFLMLLLGLAEYGSIPLTESQAKLFGLVSLFAFIALAIILFVLANAKEEPYTAYETHLIATDERTERNLQSNYQSEATRFAITIGLSIGLIFCGLMVLIGTRLILGDEDSRATAAVAVLLAFIALAVYVFIQAASRRNSLSQILNTGDYTEENRRHASSMALIAGPYWVLATLIYLGWSFITSEWWLTWVVWPIASLLYEFISSVVSGIASRHR